MAKIPVEVTFETITPLWTGDAWGEMQEIRPSSLIGSLRFWFEVLMYFGEVLKKEDFDANKGRFEKELNYKEFRKKLWEQRDNSIETQLQILAQELNLPISSIIFGTTGWRSLIDIEIKPSYDTQKRSINNKSNYKYFLGTLKLPQLKHGNKIPTWYFKKGFCGNFSIFFKVEKYILEPIFYPLLNFMHHYGYWGGKWNLGFGRLKIKQILENKQIKTIKADSTFKLSKISKHFKDFALCQILKEVNSFNELLASDKKLIIWKDKVQNKDIKKLIKSLIELKVQERAKFKHPTIRHKIFGSIKPPPKDLLPQGSKILPFIYKNKDEEILKGRFLSLSGLLTLDN